MTCGLNVIAVRVCLRLGITKMGCSAHPCPSNKVALSPSTCATRDDPQEAVFQEKRQAAEAVRQQAEAEARQRAEAAAAEMAERKDLIAQLRGMEAAARKAAASGRVHVFDPTAVSLTVSVCLEGRGRGLCWGWAYPH